MGDPLGGYLSMFAAYGETIRVPMSPKSSFFVLTRPEYAEQWRRHRRTGAAMSGLALDVVGGALFSTGLTASTTRCQAAVTCSTC